MRSLIKLASHVVSTKQLEVCAKFKFMVMFQLVKYPIKLKEDCVTSTCLSLFSVPKSYLESLDIPVFKFLRDTLSYIALLALHYAMCLSPTTVTFSGLEWIILIFFIGRYLVERKQICTALRQVRQQRDTGTPSKRFHLRALSLYER